MRLGLKTDTPYNGVSCTGTISIYISGHMTCEASAIEVTSCDPVQQCSVQCKTFQPKAGR